MASTWWEKEKHLNSLNKIYSTGANKLKLSFYAIIVIIIISIIECLVIITVFDFDYHRSITWRTRIACSSHGLINRVTFFIPSQVSLVSSLVFYFSLKIKTKKIWLNNLAKTVLYIMLSTIFCRYCRWFSPSFLYELCFSVLTTCFFYITWSVLFKHTSKNAKSIPF